jgi:hypothetical protein
MAFSAHHAHRWVFAAAVPGNAIVIDECAMIAVQLSSLVPSTPMNSAATTVQEAERAGLPSSDQPATVASPFQPLDPDVFNAAIPAFFIGRNSDGFSIARDVNGQIGGIFLFESSALSFARKHSEPKGCATIFPAERFELDLENDGNPLIGQLGSLLRWAERSRQRMAALTGKLAEAARRRLQAFHLL